MFNITMVPFTEDYLPEVDGKYLVKTKFTNSPLNNGQMIDARVTKVWNQKKGRFICSIDVQNQIVTHISNKPI